MAKEIRRASEVNHTVLVLRRLRARTQWLLGMCLYALIAALCVDFVQYATDFFKAMTTITSGLMLPLTTADLLAHAIVASVLENLDMDRLVNEVGQAVAQRILGANESVDDVAKELHERLLLRNESTKKVVFESIYRESEDAAHNVEVFMNAPSIQEARPHLRKASHSPLFLRSFFKYRCRSEGHGSRRNTYKHVCTGLTRRILLQHHHGPQQSQLSVSLRLRHLHDLRLGSRAGVWCFQSAVKRQCDGNGGAEVTVLLGREQSILRGDAFEWR